jgi:hypothetical protein
MSFGTRSSEGGRNTRRLTKEILVNGPVISEVILGNAKSLKIRLTIVTPLMDMPQSHFDIGETY